MAGDHKKTFVELRPSDRLDPCDAATVRLARVEYEAGELVVSAPRARGYPHGAGAVSLNIRLPSGSRVRAQARAADINAQGRLGECRISTDCGHVMLEETGPLRLAQVLGNTSVDHVGGDLEAHAECGDVQIQCADGSVHLSRTRGSVCIGEAKGDVYVYADSGDLSIGRAHGALEARASQGDMLVDETVKGPLVLENASGRLEIGVVPGTAVSLDLDSHVGTVYQSIELLDEPASADVPTGPPDDVVRVQARSILGDIVVRLTSRDP
ncbi:hypothetical protein DN069_13985 [Streptacidiphilus pinicola]|uniref:DUF4097 domain-containing protein n=1 Tax=Streptacidiphilus pinicola TaxID=2219663 RepID=A0A2X0INF4_9ACTN|nr:DUF4097 family beta strand repeat-containing protein [Streptacidiphilus pinicola]RAG85063.1 hypothetical protein DN069_13985 [Streptacidiphilus pinicola]